MSKLEIMFWLSVPVYLVGAYVISNWLTDIMLYKMYNIQLKIWRWRANAIRNNRTNR